MTSKLVTCTEHGFEEGLPLWAAALPGNIVSEREKSFLQYTYNKVEQLYSETKYGDYPERLESLSNILRELEFLIGGLK